MINRRTKSIIPSAPCFEDLASARKRMINRRKAIIATQVLNGGTLEAIGKKHGISKERVGQILHTVVRTVAPHLIEWHRNNRGIGDWHLTPWLRAFNVARSRKLSGLIAASAEPDPNNC